MGQPERRRRRIRPVPPERAAGPAGGPPAEGPAAGLPAPAAADTSAVMDPEAAPAAGPDAPERSTARPGGAPRAPRPTVAGHPGRAGTGPGSAGPAGSDGGPAPDAGARPTSGAGAGARAGDDREAERGLRGLVGSGSSQVSVNAALRARDAARPTDEQLAEAEEHLVIVRRNWLPREDLPRR